MKFNGYNVVVTRDIPKMTLSPGDYVTLEFRKEMDAWLLQFFGSTNLLKDGESMVTELDKKIFMNPRTYHILKKQAYNYGVNDYV